MSNSLISFNQMAFWKHGTDDNTQDKKIDEYFECLIDCDTHDQNSCRRVCSELLV